MDLSVLGDLTPFEKFDAVFYVFVFDSIDDSATIHNLSPGIFH